MKLLSFFSAKPSLPSNYKEEAWNKLKEAVDAIHRQLFISSSLEELYKAVENLCSHGMSEILYEQLKTVCGEYVESIVKDFS